MAQMPMPTDGAAMGMGESVPNVPPGLAMKVHKRAGKKHRGKSAKHRTGKRTKKR